MASHKEGWLVYDKRTSFNETLELRMNIRNAILKAADLYDFRSCDITDGCGTPSCVLGWIAHHLGWIEDGSSFLDGVTSIIGSGSDQTFFYNRMDAIDKSGDWRSSPTVCAKALRLYANKYHPITDHIPPSVRSIFEVREITKETS